MKIVKVKSSVRSLIVAILQISICLLFSNRAMAQDVPSSDGVSPQAVVAPVTVNTINELTALSEIPLKTAINLLGYYAPGDGGGGTFVYEPDYNTPESPGRVIIPTNLKGRFIRHYNCGIDEVHAEWLGARGDGVSDDQRAINDALRLCKKIVFLPKVYGVGHYEGPLGVLQDASIWILDGYSLKGTIVDGKKASTIKLLSGANPQTDYFMMLSTRGFLNANNVSVRDLILDGNFDGQDTLQFPDPKSSDPSVTIPGKATIALLTVWGGGLVVDNVSFTGYGTGYWPPVGYSHESFVLHQSLNYRMGTPVGPNFDFINNSIPVSRKGATLTNLDFTGVGRNDMFDIKRFPLAEVSHIAIGGTDNFANNAWKIPGTYSPLALYLWTTAYKASNPVCQSPHDSKDFPCEQDYPGAPVGKALCDGKFCDAKIDLTQGGGNVKNYWPSFGGEIRGVKIHDEFQGPGGNISRLHGISLTDSIGLRIEENYISNFDGVSIFNMGGWNSETTIAHNVFDRVLVGIGLQASRDDSLPPVKASADSPIAAAETIKPSEVPETSALCLRQRWKTSEDRDILLESARHRNMYIKNNVFTALEDAQFQPAMVNFYSDWLKKYAWSTDTCYDSDGNQVYQSAPYDKTETDYFEPVFENISVTNNSFSGRKGHDHDGNDLYPTGVYFAVYAPYFKNIVVTDNSFSFPDTPFTQKQLDAQKITQDLLPRVTNAISVRFKEYLKNTQYVLRGNYNDNGTEVCPHGVWWDWRPEAPRFKVCAIMQKKIPTSKNEVMITPAKPIHDVSVGTGEARRVEE